MKVINTLIAIILFGGVIGCEQNRYEPAKWRTSNYDQYDPIDWDARSLSTLPGSSLPGSTLPGSTLPGTTLPGSTLPGLGSLRSGGTTLPGNARSPRSIGRTTLPR